MCMLFKQFFQRTSLQIYTGFNAPNKKIFLYAEAHMQFLRFIQTDTPHLKTDCDCYQGIMQWIGWIRLREDPVELPVIGRS